MEVDIIKPCKDCGVEIDPFKTDYSPARIKCSDCRKKGEKKFLTDSLLLDMMQEFLVILIFLLMLIQELLTLRILKKIASYQEKPMNV